jgi:phosphate transport system substrate-binding protein
MAYTRGRCSNFDYCSIADSRRDVEVRVGDDFICPECGKPLKAPPVGAAGGSNFVVPALVGGGILVLVGGAVFLGMRMGSNHPASSPQTAQIAPAPTPSPPPAQSSQATSAAPSAAPLQAPSPPQAAAPAQQAAATPPQPPTTPPSPAPTPEPSENILARLAGSPEIGATLAPKLAAAYLTQIGDTAVKLVAGGAAGETKITGLRGDRRESIVVEATSADAGFRALGNHQADIVMAARRILPSERDSLVALGDMTSPTAEHVLGLNALSIVVNAANPLVSLSKDQIRSVYAGTLRDWSALGLTAGPIDAYGPAAGTPQAAVFSTLALAGGDMSPAIRRLPDAAQIERAVAADARGLGVVDIANIGTTRPVPIAETGSSPVAVTNTAAIATEDYPLAYRLYLYTAPGGASGIAQRFVDYALSPPGQTIIQQNGLVSQTLKPEAAAVPDTASAKFKAFVAGAKHLAIAFHFQPNSTELDQKGTRDLDRVMNYILSNHYSPDHLILIGFADNQGDPAANSAVSKKRADAVAALFTARGLPPGKVAGFGSELPIADNSTEDGREKNRRVEVFIAP